MAVAHQTVNIDGFEGYFVHKVEGQHNHTSDPEENNVKTGHQCVGGVEGFDKFRNVWVVVAVGPAEGTKCPQP